MLLNGLLQPWHQGLDAIERLLLFLGMGFGEPIHLGEDLAYVAVKCQSVRACCGFRNSHVAGAQACRRTVRRVELGGELDRIGGSPRRRVVPGHPARPVVHWQAHRLATAVEHGHQVTGQPQPCGGGRRLAQPALGGICGAEGLDTTTGLSSQGVQQPVQGAPVLGAVLGVDSLHSTSDPAQQQGRHRLQCEPLRGGPLTGPLQLELEEDPDRRDLAKTPRAWLRQRVEDTALTDEAVERGAHDGLGQSAGIPKFRSAPRALMQQALKRLAQLLPALQGLQVASGVRDRRRVQRAACWQPQVLQSMATLEPAQQPIDALQPYHFGGGAGLHAAAQRLAVQDVDIGLRERAPVTPAAPTTQNLLHPPQGAAAAGGLLGRSLR